LLVFTGLHVRRTRERCLRCACLREFAALVAQAAAQGLPALACVDELNPALAARLLAVGDDPDVGADAGVVEHLLGHGDDGFEPVVLDDPFADFAFARAGAACEQGRAVEDDGQSRSTFAGLVSTGSNLLTMCCRKSSAPSLTRGVPAPKRPSKPSFSCSRTYVFLLALPVHAKRRIGQEVVKALTE
jgi:hypothetical protein